jgi:hypothetical protein
MQLLLTIDTKPEKTMIDNEAPLCACGICGLRVTWNKWDKKWNIFIHNHHTRKEDNRKKRSQSQSCMVEKNTDSG